MKYRSGFVSNSSSSSFCIYGWLCKTYEEHIELFKKLNTYREILGYNITLSNTPYTDNEYIVGIGHTASEMDHYMVDWQDYKCKNPSSEEKENLNTIAIKLKLSTPILYSETFWS